MTLWRLFPLICLFAALSGAQGIYDRLVIDLGLDRYLEMQPGETHAFRVGKLECCTYVDPVETQVVWSVTPLITGVSIDAATGILTLAPEVPHGTVLRVFADVENGRRILFAPVYVYTPKENPLVGMWKETARLSCSDARRQKPEPPIEELIFRADGSVFVTWQTIEYNQDYWGHYEYSLEAGTLALRIDGGRFIPKDFDGKGEFEMRDGGRTLLLRHIWLGTRSAPAPPPACGHVFTRRSPT